MVAALARIVCPAWGLFNPAPIVIPIARHGARAHRARPRDCGPVSHGLPGPNPTRGGASFALDLPAAAIVEFDVLDVQGRAVWSGGRRVFAAGRNHLEWSGRLAGGRPAPPGLYLARVRMAGEPALVRRLVVLE